MMGIGFGEMVLIAGIALVVIGPEKFPDFAKLVIRTIRDLRGYVDDIKLEVAKELKPIKDELNPLKKEMNTLSRIDPEKYIDSLTKETPEKKSSSASAVHEEDQKVMDEAAAYGEDPYGWREGETGGADKGAYPEETVGYGEAVENEDTGDSGGGQSVEGEGTGESGGGQAVEGEGTGESGGGGAEGSPDAASDGEPAPPAEHVADADFDELKDAITTDSNGEPDVWTGR